MIHFLRLSFILAFLFIVAPAPCAADTAPPIRLPVSRDLWVSAVGNEANGNLGGSARLKLKSIQEMSIVDFDPAPLKGRAVRSAALHVHHAGGDILRRVSVSSLAADWVEGTGAAYEPQAGSSCFNFRRYPDEPWAYPGSDLTAVMLGQGGTVWQSADATPPDAEGWQTIEVSPAVVAARVAGISRGFVLCDDTGSEWTREGEKFTLRLYPNRYLFSRDSNSRTAPYFSVTLGPQDQEPPASPSDLKSDAAGLGAGEARVSWITPADRGGCGVAGFIVEVNGRPIPQYLVPPPRSAGSRVVMHLRDLKLKAGQKVRISVRAVDGAANESPEASAEVEVSASELRPMPGTDPQPFQQGGPLPKLGNAEVAIIDALDKVQPITGQMIPPQPEAYLAANHLWDSKHIRLHAARNEFVSFQIMVRGNVRRLRARLDFDGPGPSPQARFDGFRYVQTKAGPAGDPLVSMGEGLDVPDAGLDLPGQTSGSLLCEVYVPHDAAARLHGGTLTLSAEGRELKIPVSLAVWDFVLPDVLSFIPEMNCYDLPANEVDYYRLAHRHRVVINRVLYYQNGRAADGCAPAWDAKTQKLDFGEWDKRFGPLLDGSAFNDLPRKGVPVDIFYLPLQENWPAPMEGNYNGSYWADQAFPPDYRASFVAASRQFAQHFDERKWDKTLFMCFFNGKNNFKENGWSRGTCPWLLDEPANFQDYWALKFFGDLFHEGVRLAAGNAKMLFRADISRPQWQRDALDEALNYNVVGGGAFVQYNRMVMERKQRFGQIVIPYGSSNDPADSNVQGAAWCWDSWTQGGDGVLPWQVIGNAGSWKRGDPACLFYPGEPAGQKQPIPSVRLKSFLRGQQDVEYLALLAHLEKQSPLLFGQRVRALLSLGGQRRQTGIRNAEDAGVMAFDRLRPQDLWKVRVRVGQVLSDRHPAAQEDPPSLHLRPSSLPE